MPSTVRCLCPSVFLSNKQLEAVVVESLLFSRFNTRVLQNKQIARALVQTFEDLSVCTCFSFVFPSNTNLFCGEPEDCFSFQLIYSLYSEEKNEI